jgi:phospholipid/cholesterol/gamma-HCH transport system substrate-binding protein
MSPTAKIGLFTLAAMVILGGFILKIENVRLWGDGERQLVEARMPSAAGVDRKAAVRIAGVRVGVVEDIRLDGAEAILVLALDPQVELHEGASARVTSLGMLGDKAVEVMPGDPSRPLLPAGAVLEGSAPPTVDDVLRLATDIGGDVKEVTAALRSSLGGAQGAANISEIVDNIRELTDSLKTLITQNQANVNETTANFREFSGVLRDELPVIADKMNRLADQLSGVVDDNRSNLQASLDNIRDLSDRLRTSADNLNDITGKIAAGEGSIGKLVNDDETVDNLNSTLKAVEKGVGSLEESLGRYDRYRLDMTIRGEALPSVDTGDGRTAFGFDLWATDRRFLRVEGVDTPFGRTRTRTETVTTMFPDGTSESYTTEKVKTDDSIAINAQIGYSVRPGTLVRAGLIESVGGFGIDWDVDLGAPRPLRLTVEAYDFNRELDRNAHLRFETRYHITPHLFLMAGWDDPLEAQFSSVLIGGGVVWRDDDIKYSLGLAGGALK